MTSYIGTTGATAYGFAKFGHAGYVSSKRNLISQQHWEDIYGNDVDLSRKSFLVTGANSGVGFSSAHYFAQHKGTVHILCRDEKRGKEALEQIKSETNNNNVYLHICNLSESKDIREFVRKFNESGYQVDVLVNNAGAMMSEKEIEYNSELIEKTLSINTLGTFLLTNLLIPNLQKSVDPRVIVVSSGGQLTQTLVLRDDWLKDGYPDPTIVYARTKRHLSVLTELWAEKYSSRFRIKFFSMHPGFVDTKAVKISMPKFHKFYSTVSKLRTLEEGSDTIKWLAVSNEPTLEQSGEFFRDREIEVKHIKFAQTHYTHDEAVELWKWCSELSHFNESNTIGSI